MFFAILIRRILLFRSRSDVSFRVLFGMAKTEGEGTKVHGQRVIPW